MDFKRLFLAFSLIILAFSSFAQTKNSKKEVDFAKSCKAVVVAFYKKDVNKLNSYINPSFGMYKVYQPGFGDPYSNQKQIANIDPMLVKNKERWFEYVDIIKPGLKNIPLKFEKLPHWNCEIRQWDKTGFFADKINKNDILSNTMENFIVKNEQPLKKELTKIKNIENKSRKVIFTTGKDGLIFHMAYINKKWYLTIIELTHMICA